MCKILVDIQTIVYHGLVATDARVLVYVCPCNIYMKYTYLQSIYMYVYVFICMHIYAYISIHTYVRLYIFTVFTVKTAGGVATSGLEMSQNSQRLVWTRDEVDKQLEGIMKLIHRFFF